MKQQWEINQENLEDSEHSFGLSIIPVSSNKIPFNKWAEFQKKISPVSEWHPHYLNQGTVGIITGRVSGNLEIIDVDVKNDPHSTIMNEFRALIPNDLYDRLIIQTTPNKGFHLIYRCPEVIIEGNQKLALHSNKEVILETRGEGGYFCSNKINNRIIQGTFDLEGLNVDIPVITANERELLLETARGLTRYFPLVTDKSKNEKPFNYKVQAINDFNGNYSIIDLFKKHNWSVVSEDNEKVYLLRDGSLASHSGYYFKATKIFFCFSTSTDFEPGKTYNHFQILQILEGQNDYRATLRLLMDYGFEVNVRKKEKVTLEDISTYLNDSGIRHDSFLQDLTLNNAIIEEIDYNTLYINLKEHFDQDIPRSRFEEVMKSRFITEVNPVMDFVERNIHIKPHGTFDKWLDCMILMNKSLGRDIILHYLKKWYVGLVAQTLDHEFPNEFFLCLLSTKQGIGKTTFLRKYTLPKELQKYCAEHSINYDDDFKVMMGQSILIIDDEMDGRTYETEKTFKNMMSQDVLTTRRKYDRRISRIKRRCSFAGSGNNLNVIRERQNRRIITLEIEKFDFKKMEEVDYTELFMEAYHLYKSGFEYSYKNEDQVNLDILSNDYIQKTDVDMILDVQVLLPESGEDVYQMSLLDLVTTLLDKYPYFSKRLNGVTVGKLLNDRGFKSIRKGRNKTTCYEISKVSDIIKSFEGNSNILCLG